MESKTPLSDAALSEWPSFVATVEKRLSAGRASYGDSSFTRPNAEILGELMQEAEDLAGWGFVLWYRCRELMKRSQ